MAMQSHNHGNNSVHFGGWVGFIFSHFYVAVYVCVDLTVPQLPANKGIAAVFDSVLHNHLFCEFRGAGQHCHALTNLLNG